NLATKAGVEAAAGGSAGISLHAPLIDLTKAKIVTRGAELGVEFGLTLSCYDPVARKGAAVKHCGRCDACQLRKKGFAEAGVDDPTAYAA
ncbi:MAG: 7-cyano-7-deazaguanine synthase, partial [Rhodospirillales bacterium]